MLKQIAEIVSCAVLLAAVPPAYSQIQAPVPAAPSAPQEPSVSRSATPSKAESNGGTVKEADKSKAGEPEKGKIKEAEKGKTVQQSVTRQSIQKPVIENDPSIIYPMWTYDTKTRGKHDTPLEKISKNENYRTWKHIKDDQVFSYSSVPSKINITLRKGDDFEFYIIEDRKKDAEWFARYDNKIVEVDVESEHSDSGYLKNRRVAEIEIEAFRKGETIVELIYANREKWFKNSSPYKVVRIYVKCK